MVTHYPVWFSGYMHCVSEDMMVLVFHVTSQDHLTKRSFDFIGSNR